MSFTRVLKRWRRDEVVFSDLATIILAFYLAFWIRFLDEGFLFPKYLPIFKKTLPLVIVVYFTSFLLFGLYKGLWRYTNESVKIRKKTRMLFDEFKFSSIKEIFNL